MGKINSSVWQEFKIIDLFYVRNTHSILKSSIVAGSGNTPYVTASNENNGVLCYINYDENLVEPGDCIMIGGKTLIITYQKEPFFSNDSHNLALYLKDKHHRTEWILLFIATALKASIGSRYSWSDSISAKSIQKDTIRLPVDQTGRPDFSYMETYMKNRAVAVSSSLTALQSAKKLGFSQKLATKTWAKFRIGELFNIVKGKRLTKADMIKGMRRFIGASAINNGITALISNNEHLHPGNTITVSYNGSVGEAFYQEEPFWASDDVNVLYPKFEMNVYIAMFIIPILRKIGQKYKFIDKWKKEDMERDFVILPVCTDGAPDYQFMSDCTKVILERTRQNLQGLQACI